MMKPFASLVSLALALTPIVMIAVSAAQSQTQAPAPAAELRTVSQDADKAADACRKVRVIAIGYGEPAGPRCEGSRG